MKKLALIITVAVSVLCMSFVLVDSNSMSSNNQSATINSTDDARAYIDDVRYDLDKGKIDVVVSVKGGEFKSSYHVKVTPKDQITGVVVEGALYCYVNRSHSRTSTVTFHCYSGKEGDAPMCRAYTFIAEIVD